MPTAPAKDACDVLDADHIAVKHLFVEYARLATAPTADPAGEARGAIARSICSELTVHAQIEEEIFYPALEAALPEAAGLLQEARAEHDEAKQLIARIEALQAPGPEMDELVAQLACAIEQHVKEERDELFPKARGTPGLDLLDLAAKLQERQQELQVQPAPA